MPNWCDTYIQILAKEETIRWIHENLNDKMGRRWDDPKTRIGLEFVMGDERWLSLEIWARIAGTTFPKFLDSILDNFKNVHIKGQYCVELCGAGDFEEGNDEQGNRYYFYTELPIDFDEEYDEGLYEIPTQEELEFYESITP